MSVSALPSLRLLSERALLGTDTAMLLAAPADDVGAPKYTWGVILPGQNEAHEPDRDGTGPSRKELYELYMKKLNNECSDNIAIASITSALLHDDDEGFFYALNAKGEFVGAATVEQYEFPWDVLKWMAKLYTLVTTDVFSGTVAASPLERYRKAKAHGLTFPLNHVCTAGADPYDLIEVGKPRDPDRPRGAGKALVRGIREFVEQSYVQPMAQHLRWAPDVIRVWCFLEADVSYSALWFWKEKLAFETDPKVVRIDEGVYPMYRPLFSDKGADHVLSPGPSWTGLFLNTV